MKEKGALKTEGLPALLSLIAEWVFRYFLNVTEVAYVTYYWFWESFDGTKLFFRYWPAKTPRLLSILFTEWANTRVGMST